MSLFSVKRSWFHTFSSWLTRPASNINRQLNRRVPQIDVLEERLTPATGSFNSTTGTITFNYTATGSTAESVTLTNNGSTISATGNVTGTKSFTTSTVKAVLITASGNSTGQGLTFAGTASYSLSSGISISGIDSVSINASLNTAASNILMTIGNGIAINSPITTTTGNITIYANNGATSSIGDFYGIRASANVTTSGGNIDWTGRGGTDSVGVKKIGILIDNGSTISAGGSGHINLTGTGGESTGVYNHGVSIVGKNSPRSTIVKTANGNITINGNGGGTLSGGSNNYGLLVHIGGVISSGGIGTVNINVIGGNSLSGSNMGMYVDADAISTNDSTFIGSTGGDISIHARGGRGAASPLGFRGRGQIGSYSSYLQLTSVNNSIFVTLIPGQGGTQGIYNETSLGSIVSGQNDIEINLDHYSSFFGKTSLVTSGQLKLWQVSSGFYIPFVLSSFANGFQVNPLGNGMADLSKGLIIGKQGNNSEVSLDSQLSVGGSITINSLFSTVSNAVTSVTGSVNISALQAIDVSAPITTGSGDIVLSANNGASPVSGDFYGVRVSANVTTNGGNIQLIGRGGDSSTGQKHGIYINNGATIKATASGSISISGKGGTNIGNQNRGVYLTGGSKVTTTGTGDISIVGTAGSGAGNGNTGVFIDAVSIVSASGTGNVLLTAIGGSGAGSSNYGLYFTGSGSSIFSGGTFASIEASGNSNSESVLLADGANLEVATGGEIRLTADSVGLLGLTPATVMASGGIVNIRNRAIGTIIDLGGTDGLSTSPLKLGLTDTELDCFNAATIIIGRTDSLASGSISFSSSITRSLKTNFTLQTGQNINIDGGMLDSSGGKIVLSTPAPGAVSATKSGIDITSSSVIFANGSRLNIDINGTLLDTKYDQLNLSGSLDLAGTSLVLSGSIDIELGNVLTIVSATLITGQFADLLENAVISQGGRDFRINYFSNSVTLTLVRAPTITSSNSKSSIYGNPTSLQVTSTGFPLTFIYSLQGTVPAGVSIGTNTGLLSVSPSTAVGSYSFSVIVSNGVGTPASEILSLNIGRKTLTVTADDKSKNYDGLAFTAFTSSISGYVNSESVANITVGTISYIGSAVLATNSGVSIITPVLSGFSADNYAFEIAAGTLTINKAALTLTADNKNKTYNGSVFSGYTYAYTGFVNGETVAAITPGTVTYTGTAITANTAGSYVITPAVSGFSATNYNAPILADGTLTINKAALTLTAENKAKTYDGSVFSGYSYIFAGFVNNESVSDITPGTITFTGTAIPATAAGSYVITPSISGFAATNYNTPNLVEGILTINKATLTVTPDSKAKTYDGLVFTGFTSTISGYVNSETSSVITGSPTYSGAATSATAAGTYASITAVVSGMSANNYTIVAGAAGTLTINKATLTVTPDTKSKTYDGLVFTGFASTISGYVNSETSSVITGSPTYSGAATSETAAGTYASITAVVSGMSSNNYTIVAGAAGTLTINKATLTVTPDTKSKTYDGLVFTGFASTISGYVNSETSSVITGSPTYSGAATSATAAGTYASITAVVSGMSSSNYTIVAGSAGTLTINKATLTVTPDAKAKTYDGLVFTGFTSTISGYVNSETSSILTGSPTYSGAATSETAAGTYASITAVVSGMSANNYNIVAGAASTLNINKATLTVTPDTKAKTYDGLVFTGFTSTISGYVNSETSSVITGSPTYSGAATSATAAGTYASITAVVSSMSASNYTIVADAAGTLTINKATLTVTPDSKSKTYDGVASTGFSSSYTGFVNSENGSVVTGTAGFGGTAIGAVAAGSYTIIATSGTLSAANYDLVFQAGTLTINKALLSVTADNKTKTYDGLTFSAFTSVISGFVGTEDLSAVSGSIGYLGAAVSATGAGNYTILPTSGTLSAANYAFSFSSGVLSIAKATLSVLADNKSKTYNGQVFTGFTYTLSGFVNGEGPSLVNGSLAFGGDARAATNAGDYQIIPTAGTLMAVNYAFNFLPGTLTINKAVLTVTADNRSKTYDGQPSTGFTASYTGFANGEKASVISGAPGFSGTAIGVVAAGNYPINPTPGNITAPNYDFAFQAGTLVINKALLTVTADNKTKTYDGQVFTAFSSVINGFVNNEDLSAVSGSAGYIGAATSATATGTYPILPTTGSLSAANYAFAFSQGALTIGKATLTVSADNKIKIYDGQVFSAFTYTLTGFANGDGPNLVTGSSSIGGNARFAINAGEYQIVPTVGTLSASNYTFNFAPGILTISKAILLVTAGNFTKTYDGLALNGFTSAITGFVNGENMSVVSGNPEYSGTGTTASVAGSHALSPIVGTLAATNYTFAFQDGLVTINRAPLMITADNITKTYDGQVYTSFTTSFNGFVNAENAIVVTGTASFSGSAMTATQVGQYEIAVTLGTLSASNYVLSFTPGTLTINKALLTLTADNKSKTYDGLGFSAFSANVSGFVNGETAAVVLTGNPLFKGPATTATQKGQYLIVPEAGTLHAANYRFATFVTGSLDILRSGPMVTGAQTANFIVNQMLAIPAFRVSDPDSGLLGILDITVTTTRGKITIGSNTAQSITFANTILSANQMLAKIKYTTATDSCLNATISVTAQDRDAAGAVVGSWTMSLAPSAGVFAKIQDPSKPGKTSLVVQGSVKNESIVVKPVSASNLTSYTVSMTGMPTQVFTGITGRILAYASGGDDTINVSAVKISTLLSGGEGNDIILGGSAADTIFGNGGNDLLIGGLGADIINGDYGNDILVDGSVTLKSKTDTLDKVLATWNSLPAPTTSIYNNITARLSVVFDKLNNDTMGGGNGIDWFWSTTTGAVADTIGIFTGEKRRTI